MNKDKVICKCKGVTKGDVLKALKNSDGSYKAVRKTTGAGSKCGKCKDDIKAFIKKHRDD